MHKPSNQGARSVGTFRLRSLYLFALPLPFLLLWLYEGGFILGGISLDRVYVAVHRICGWLIPLTSGSIFAFGTAQTEPDPRVVAMGIQDPRWVWLQRWQPVIGVFLLTAAVSAAVLGRWSTVSIVQLAVTTTTATLFALAVAFALTTLTGTVPGVAALGTTIIVVGAMLLPPLLGLPIWLSLSPGPLGWLRGEGLHVASLIHAAVVLGLTLAIFWFALNVPRDTRRIRWITNFRGDNA